MLMTRSARVEGLLCAAAGAVAFSGKAILAKMMYRLGADAISVVGMRMAMSLPLFMVMIWWTSREVHSGRIVAPKLTGRLGWQVVGLGFCGYYLASTLDFMGLQYISASLERAILYLNPTMVLVMSALFFRQQVRLLQWLAVGVAYVGVCIVWLHDWQAALAVGASTWVHGLSAVEAVSLGSLLVFGSALSYAIYLMGSGAMVQTYGSMWLVGRASAVACLFCITQWVLTCWGTSGSVGGLMAWTWEVYALSAINAVFCTVLPIWLVMRGVQRLGAATAAQIGMVGPLSTIWMAAWFLDEPISASLLVGTGAILMGILLLAKVPKQPLSATPGAALPHQARQADRA
ncbi:MAG: DMT family transporter [Aquabacterium sp.]